MLTHIQIFRSLAITFIVAFHSLGWFKWNEHPNLINFLLDLFGNGTVLFVFIAGYLFRYLSSKFTIKTYLFNKIKNVIIPYLLVSIPAIWYSAFHQEITMKYPDLIGASKPYIVFWLYIKGGAHTNYALWFIPMIAILYAMCPIFMLFFKRPRLYYVLLIAIPISILGHRPPFPSLNTIHSAVYFASIYLIGMFACEHRERIEGIIVGHLRYIILLFAAFLVLQYMLSDHHGNYHAKRIFSFDEGIVDWMYLQKIILCFALLGVSKKYLTPHCKRMLFLADASFFIFFNHIYFFRFCKAIVNWKTFEGDILKWAILCLSAILFCTLLAKMGQFAFGKYSRILIGVPLNIKFKQSQILGSIAPSVRLG
jgi:probable poly-beta-1,6-N-acetyl-D-glucosamine export protein